VVIPLFPKRLFGFAEIVWDQKKKEFYHYKIGENYLICSVCFKVFWNSVSNFSNGKTWLYDHHKYTKTALYDHLGIQKK